MKTRTTNKIILVSLALLLALLAVTGCSGGFFKGRSGTMKTYAFRQGTEGIAMGFLEEMPPSSLFVGTPFSMGLRIKNVGAYDITDRAEIKIIPPPKAFAFQETDTKPFTLKGKSLYTKEGEEDIIMFPMRALCYPGYGGTAETTVVRNYTGKIEAAACYYYETVANADLCIDTMKYLRAKTDKPVCDMQPITFSGGQGGPVGVVSISPTVIPKSDNEMTLQLSLSIKDLSGQNIRIYQQDADCNQPEEQDKVELDVQVGGQNLWCEPYQIKVKQKDAVSTICTAPIDPSLGAYTTPISIKMTYKVRQGIVRNIALEPPPAGIDCKSIEGAP